MAAIPTPTLRGEIENVLKHWTPDNGDADVLIAATSRWLANHLGAPLRAVEIELLSLRLAGQVITRRVRSGELLWKWKPADQDQWDAFAGPGTLAGRR